MAMEEDINITRRLRVRTPKLTGSLQEKDMSPLGQRLSKRKAEVSLESLYLQKNYKDPSSTPLETIFESPRLSKGVQQGRASPDSALLMANRKLKRLCIFSSHHQLPRNKMKQRKERALKMKRLTGVQVPLGKAFSEDDVLAVLSCLAEEDAATPSLYQEQEREVVDPPNASTPDLVEGMISVLSSLQMDSEPSLSPPNQAQEEATPTQSQPTKEKKLRRRCELIPQVKAVSSSIPSASTSTHQSPLRSQPPKTTAWVKRLKRKSSLASQLKNSSVQSSDPETATSIYSPQSCFKEAARPKGMGQNILCDMEEHTTSTKNHRLKSGNKRIPDNILPMSTKKQCNYKTLQETNTDPSPTLQHGKGLEKDKKRRVFRAKHHNFLAEEPSTSNTLINIPDPSSSEQDTASSLLQAPFSPLSPPLPIPHKRGLSPTLLSSLMASGDTADGGDAEGGEKAVGKEGGTSPSSPSSRLAALSLQSSPTHLSPLVKPRKIRRRSARLSIGSDVMEGLRRIPKNNYSRSDVSLGTVWASFSPLERKQKAEVNKGGGDSGGDDSASPPSSTVTTKKRGQSKGRRQSNLYCRQELMDTVAESSITKSTSDVDDFSFRPISPPPISLDSLTQVPTNPRVVQGSVTLLHHQPIPCTPVMEHPTHLKPPLPSPQPLRPSVKREDIPKVLIGDVMPPGNPQVMTDVAGESANLRVFGKAVGEEVNPIGLHSGLAGFLSTPAQSSDGNTTTYNKFTGYRAFSSLSPSSPPPHALTLSQADLLQRSSLPGEDATTSEDDRDSPVLSGILANKTLIHMGKVYYGPAALSPMSSSAPV